MRQGARGWCTGMNHRDRMGRVVGGGFRMGNTCTHVVDSCQCMAKPVQLKKKKKSLLQHHSSKASIFQHSVFFMLQLSYPYMTTGKIIASTKRTFVGKVMSLLFNMLSRLVIAFLPRSKCLLISWLQSPSAVTAMFYSYVFLKIYSNILFWLLSKQNFKIPFPVDCCCCC